MKPRALRTGDTIGLVSPASPISEVKLEQVRALLAEQGYRTRLFPHVLDSHGFLAGTDRDRANDLNSAFADPDIAAVLCTRGGYGCARLLPFLDLDQMAASGKLFLGFSDITTLHLALNRRGLATAHAPMGITLSVPREPWVTESFLATLRGENSIPLGAPAGRCVVPGTAAGIVTGGCLCLLTDSIGTPDAIDFAGKIVLIEDVDENPHRIDAMLTHLLNAGEIQGAAGIVVGEMTRTDDRCDEGIGAMPWREMVTERLGPLNIPLITDFPFGHAAQMLTLPLGIGASLNADEGTLQYPEALCA